MPSASRASARPHGGSPHSVASSGRSALGRVAEPGGDVLGRVGDEQRAAAHPHRDAPERRGGHHRGVAAGSDLLAGPEVDPVAGRQLDLALAGTRLEHRRHPQRRPVAVGVGHRPAARVAWVGEQQRADDRQPAARRRDRRRAHVGDQLLVQEHVLAVGVKRLGVVGPRLLLEAPVGVHKRREAPELHPPQQQFLRAARDQPLAEVAADVVRPVREARGRRGQRGRHQRAQRPEVGWLIAAPGDPDRLLPGPARAAEQHALAGVDLVERALHRAPVQQPLRPARLGAAPPVGELDLVGVVEALAVVGLDPLHAEREHARGLLAPPRLGRLGGEVDGRAVAHPPLRHPRLAVGPADEVPVARALRIVGRRRAVQARRLRVGRDLAAVGVEVHPRRHPHHRAHPVRAHPPDQAGRVGELVRVELPGVVLRRPR